VVSSSSTKKAARLAQKGKGKKVRFQGGTLFPLVVMGVLVLGLALIVYARVSRPAADASPPTIDDHWHAAYGFDLCDAEGQQQLAGAKEEADANGIPISREYLRYGVHSHEDGVIHWHPTTSAAVGSNAKLGVFLDVYGVELDDESLRFPEDQLGGKEYIEGETTCGDEDGELAVVVWDNFSDEGAGTVYTANFDNIRMTTNSMVFVIAFLPASDDPRDVQKPPWAAQLPELGAIDTPPSDLGPDGSTPVSVGDTTPASGSTSSTGTTGVTGATGETGATTDATTDTGAATTVGSTGSVVPTTG